MSSAILYSLVSVGFSAAFIHSILPNHWLPFVLVGRIRNWRIGKVLGVTAIAGGGHVLFTTLLGFVMVYAGIQVLPSIEEYIRPLIAFILAAVGIYHTIYYFLRKGHYHAKPSDKATIISLFLMLTFSPCEAFLPIYLTAVPFGWKAFLALSVVLAMATLSGMLFFTALSFQGALKLNLHFLEHYERMIIAVILFVLAIIFIVVH